MQRINLPEVNDPVGSPIEWRIHTGDFIEDFLESHFETVSTDYTQDCRITASQPHLVEVRICPKIEGIDIQCRKYGSSHRIFTKTIAATSNSRRCAEAAVELIRRRVLQ